MSSAAVFSGARPEKGRFRDYLRTSLIHLVADYRRSQHKHAKARAGAPLDEVASVESDHDLFSDSWRDELLHQAWEALRVMEASSGRPHYTALKLRVDHPDWRSAHIARQLNQRDEGTPLYNDASVRKVIQRARAKFAECLIEEVSRSIETTDRERIEQELIDLDLLVYCRQVLDGRTS